MKQRMQMTEHADFRGVHVLGRYERKKICERCTEGLRRGRVVGRSVGLAGLFMRRGKCAPRFDAKTRRHSIWAASGALTSFKPSAFSLIAPLRLHDTRVSSTNGRWWCLNDYEPSINPRNREVATRIY